MLGDIFHWRAHSLAQQVQATTISEIQFVVRVGGSGRSATLVAAVAVLGDT